MLSMSPSLAAVAAGVASAPEAPKARRDNFETSVMIAKCCNEGAGASWSRWFSFVRRPSTIYRKIARGR